MPALGVRRVHDADHVPVFLRNLISTVDQRSVRDPVSAVTVSADPVVDFS
jgi:hypothetical protein